MKFSTKLIIFSKNRAMQLECLIRSIRERLPIFDEIEVIYKATGRHKEAYRQLTNKVIWTQEKDFEKDTKNAIDLKHKYTCFMVDDDIVYRDGAAVPFDSLKEGYCFSLRLGDNITHTYHFSYPMSVDGHIFLTSEIKPMVDAISFINPNKFEAKLQRYDMNIIYSEQSCLVGVPVNRVSDTSHCVAGEKHPFSEDALCNLFLRGKRMDYKNMNFGIPDNVHKEVEICLM